MLRQMDQDCRRDAQEGALELAGLIFSCLELRPPAKTTPVAMTQLQHNSTWMTESLHRHKCLKPNSAPTNSRACAPPSVDLKNHVDWGRCHSDTNRATIGTKLQNPHDVRTIRNKYAFRKHASVLLTNSGSSYDAKLWSVASRHGRIW